MSDHFIEALGFVSGAWCIWLVVKENIWNWPIGLANSLVYSLVFFQARLFADAGLQVVYFVIGILGWYWWLRGGENRTPLKVTRAGRRTLAGAGVFIVVGTLALMWLLERVRDSAPFLDSLTTVLSLSAQYLLTRKFIDNWYFWIAADMIYIGLYLQKGLYLTAILYGIFLLMCFAGLKAWAKELR